MLACVGHYLVLSCQYSHFGAIISCHTGPSALCAQALPAVLSRVPTVLVMDRMFHIPWAPLAVANQDLPCSNPVDREPMTAVKASIAIQLAWCFTHYSDWSALAKTCVTFHLAVKDTVWNITLMQYSCIPLFYVGKYNWVRLSPLVLEDRTRPCQGERAPKQSQQVCPSAPSASSSSPKVPPSIMPLASKAPSPYSPIPSKAFPTVRSLPDHGTFIKRFLSKRDAPRVVIDPTPDELALEQFDQELLADA